jgi:hypothetical protein
MSVIPGSFVPVLEKMKKSYDLHKSEQATALEACMKANGAEEQANEWRAAMSKSEKKLDTLIARFKKMAQDPSKVTDVLKAKATIDFIMLTAETSESVGIFYKVFSEDMVLDIFGKPCFAQYKVFIQKLFLEGSKAMIELATAQKAAVKKMKSK